jgi:hypothetical protein
MLETKWKQARRWAAEARAQQKQSRWEARLSLVIAIAAALCAAVAAAAGGGTDGAATGTTAATRGITVSASFSFAAGLLAVVSAFVGRHILDSDSQIKWIAARSAAETIQSECYRYAGRVTPYNGSPAQAAKAFDELTAMVAASAREKGALPPASGAENTERPPPPQGMDASWYADNRLQKQAEWYLQQAAEHRGVASRLRYAGFGFGIAGAVLGFMGGALQSLAGLTPFVGAVTTIAASLTAFGSIDRHTFLAGSYDGMADAIESLLGRHKSGLLSDTELVSTGEDLFSGEYRAWTDRMAQPAKAKDDNNC